MSVKFFLMVPCFLWVIFVNAQKKLLLSDTIPLNPKVHHGVLENGFSYYIFRDSDAGKKILFTLIEKAGNLNGELSTAHFIEHLSFRGTENFPNGLRKFMSGLGFKPGTDLSASTAATMTTYKLRIPEGDSILLKYGLQALYDFSKGRLYIPTEVEEERAAVLNEAISANDQRLFSLNQQMYLLLDKKEVYAPHIPEIIQSTENMTIETLRDFDRQWYRPDMQGLIIVGDINEHEMEKKVKAIFSTLKSRASDDGVPSVDIYKQYDVPLTGSNKLVVVNNGADQPTVLFKIIKKRKTVMGIGGSSTKHQFRIKLMDELYNELIKDRFNNLNFTNLTGFRRLSHTVSRRAIHPFSGIDAMTTQFGLNHITDARDAVKIVMTELRRVQQWGFIEKEFLRAKETVRNSIKQNLETQTSQSIASELINYFLNQAAFPANAMELKSQLLDKISLSEINAMAKDWIGEDGNTDVLFLVPDEKDPNIPDEKQVFDWIRAGISTNVKPYIEKTLKSLPPPPGNVNRNFTQSELTEIGATQLMLSNGAKVVIKRLGSAAENPLPGRNEIVLQGFRAGGTSIYSSEDYASASIAANLIVASGIASLNNSEFKGWLRNKNRNGQLFVNLYINDVEEGIVGYSSLNNVGGLLHLVYLYFTEPRIDKDVFNEKFKHTLGNTRKFKSNDVLFRDSIQSVISGKRFSRSEGKPQLKKAFHIYKERFSSVRDFTFVITGYFETEDVIEQVARYLGALPNGSSDTQTSSKNSKSNGLTERAIINEDLRVTMIGDSTGNVDIKMLFKGKLDLTIRNKLLLDVTKNVFNILLFNRLREQEKGVYSVISGTRFNDNPNDFFLDIEFATAPENVERLTDAVIDEFRKIANGNLDDNIFTNAKAATNSRISRDLIDANYVNSYIMEQLHKGTMSVDGLKRQEILVHLTKQDLIDLIRDSLDKEHYMLFELL